MYKKIYSSHLEPWLKLVGAFFNQELQSLESSKYCVCITRAIKTFPTAPMQAKLERIALQILVEIC